MLTESTRWRVCDLCNCKANCILRKPCNSFEEDWHVFSYAGLIVDLRAENTEAYDWTYGSSSTMIFLMPAATVAMLRIGPDRAIRTLATRRDTAGSSISSLY